MITRSSPSLISYQNGRKKGLIIAGNNRKVRMSMQQCAWICAPMKCPFRHEGALWARALLARVVVGTYWIGPV
jgi:hypothetical protein